MIFNMFFICNLKICTVFIFTEHIKTNIKFITILKIRESFKLKLYWYLTGLN